MDKKPPKDNLIKFPSKTSTDDYEVIGLTENELEQIKQEEGIDIKRIIDDMQYVDTAYDKVFEYTKFIEKCAHYMVQNVDSTNFSWLERDLKEIFLKLSEKKVDFD